MFWPLPSFAAPGFGVVRAGGEAGSVWDSAVFPELPWLLASCTAAGAGCLLRAYRLPSMGMCLRVEGPDLTSRHLVQSLLIVATALKVLPTGAGGGGTSSSLTGSLAASFLSQKVIKKKVLGFISSMPDGVEGYTDCGGWSGLCTYHLLICNYCTETRGLGLWFACLP